MREAIVRAVAGLIFAVIVLATVSAGPVHAASTTYTYDPLGRVISATYPNGSAVAYAYDGAGNRTQVSNMAITTAALGPVVVGHVFSQTLVSVGGTGAIVYAVAGGALPAGLSLTPSSGLISGTPTSATPYAFTITATDSGGLTASRSYSGTGTTGP